MEREMESTSSEFFNNLKKEWTDKSHIFIPFNKNQNHSGLLYIDVTKKSVYFFDPSPVDKPNTAASYMKVFVKCYGTVFPKSRFKWKLQRCVCLHQNDGCNCEIYIIHYIREILSGRISESQTRNQTRYEKAWKVSVYPSHWIHRTIVLLAVSLKFEEK